MLILFIIADYDVVEERCRNTNDVLLLIWLACQLVKGLWDPHEQEFLKAYVS